MAERNLADLEKWVIEGTDLSGGDFTNADLHGHDLEGGKFKGASFVGSDLSHGSLYHADLSDADLRNTNLNNTVLSGACLKGANMIGAYMRDAQIEEDTDFSGCVGVVDAGTDDRGYHFIGVKQSDGSWMVKAGCRWFGVEEAVTHWTFKGNEGALALVRRITEG